MMTRGASAGPQRRRPNRVGQLMALMALLCVLPGLVTALIALLHHIETATHLHLFDALRVPLLSALLLFSLCLGLAWRVGARVTLACQARLPRTWPRDGERHLPAAAWQGAGADALAQAMAQQDRAREQERQRIARDIHDDMGQNLMVLRIELAQLAERRQLDDASRSMASIAVGEVDAVIKSMRSIINDLRPPVLDLGLMAALDWLANRFERHTGVHCQLSGPGQPIELDDERATCIFRIVQELLSNVSRHAKASAVSIDVSVHKDTLLLVLADDGVGFAPVRARTDSAFGLRGIEERISVLGGSCRYASQPGHGVTVTLCMALPAAPPHDQGQHDAAFG